MATSSFTKEFTISDPKVIEELLIAMENPIKVKVRKIDFEAETKIGIELLRTWLNKS